MGILRRLREWREDSTGTLIGPNIDAESVDAGSVNTGDLNDTEWVVDAGGTELFDALSNIGPDGTLIVVGGQYNITQEHPIPDGLTWININEPTYTRADSSVEYMFRGVGTFESYDGPSNILIKGGRFELDNTLGTSVSGITIANGDDITIRDAEFYNCYNYHHLEIRHSTNARVENCDFYGLDGERVTEALQLDHDGSSTPTPVSDISIVDCRFEDTLPNANAGRNVAIGNHKSNSGVVYKNITIDDCTFIDWDSFAINANDWSDLTVSNPICETASTEERSGLMELKADSGNSISNITVENPTFKGTVDNTFGAVINVSPESTESVTDVKVLGGSLDTHGSHGVQIIADDVRVDGVTTSGLQGKPVLIRPDGTTDNEIVRVADVVCDGEIELGYFNTSPSTNNIRVSGCDAPSLLLGAVDTVEVTGNDFGSITEDAPATNVQRHDNWVGGSWVP